MWANIFAVNSETGFLLEHGVLGHRDLHDSLHFCKAHAICTRVDLITGSPECGMLVLSSVDELSVSLVVVVWSGQVVHKFGFLKHSIAICIGVVEQFGSLFHEGSHLCWIALELFEKSDAGSLLLFSRIFAPVLESGNGEFFNFRFHSVANFNHWNF